MSGGARMTQEKNINIAIIPTWETVKSVLEQATQFLAGKDQDFISATTMCVTELIENAVKYGTLTPNGGDITFDMTVDEEKVKIQISNGIRNASDFEHVQRIIQHIESSDDPQQLYVQRLKELAERPKPGLSQLGLYRIAYEGRFRLEHRYVDGVLTVSAHRAIA